MKPEKSKVSSQGTAVVLALNGSGADIAKRLRLTIQAVSQAGISVTWILVGDNSTADFLKNQDFVRRLQAQILRQSSFHGDWSAFRAALLASNAKRLLLIPDQDLPKAGQLQALVKMTGENQWLLSRRGAHPVRLNWMIRGFLRVPSADLGAPSLVRREALAPLAQCYPANEILLGQRLYAAGIASGMSVAELPASKGVQVLSTWQALGLNSQRGGKYARRMGEGALYSLALILLGAMLYSRIASLGLLMLGLGILSMASFLGKPE